MKTYLYRATVTYAGSFSIDDFCRYVAIIIVIFALYLNENWFLKMTGGFAEMIIGISILLFKLSYLLFFPGGQACSNISEFRILDAWSTLNNHFCEDWISVCNRISVCNS